MYKNKIVCAIKHNNIPLPEDKDTVFIPFNTEYSIYLKNMSLEVVYISLFVNGKNVNPFHKIKLFPQATATIEKFQDTNHRFVFKEKSLELQNVRKNKDEDSLIRIECCFEKNSFSDFFKKEIKREYFFPNKPLVPTCDQQNFKTNFSDSISYQTNSLNDYKNSIDKKFSSSVIGKNGFTAPGRKKEEKDAVIFTDVFNIDIKEQFLIILKLEESKLPILDKDLKKVCPTCGKKFKSKYFFCPFDGTYLDEVHLSKINELLGLKPKSFR